MFHKSENGWHCKGSGAAFWSTRSKRTHFSPQNLMQSRSIVRPGCTYQIGGGGANTPFTMWGMYAWYANLSCCPLPLNQCAPQAVRMMENCPGHAVLHASPSGQVKVKVKVTFTLEKATKAQRGSRCTALLFL